MSRIRTGIAVAIVTAGLALGAGQAVVLAEDDEATQTQDASEPAADDAAVDRKPADAQGPADETGSGNPEADTLVTTPPPNPQPPKLGEIRWTESEAHCRFLREGNAEDPEDPDSSRYLLLIDRFFDSQVTLERAYARIDGLIRELALKDRKVDEDTEIREYATWGDDPVSVTVRMKLVNRSKAVSRYSGRIVLERDGLSTTTRFDGTCAPDAANKRAKS